MTALPTEVLLDPVPDPAPAAPAVTLRLVRAPSSAPAYDDEPVGGPGLRLVPALRKATPPEASPPTGNLSYLETEVPPPAVVELRPGPQVFAHALTQRLLEVLAGVRPLSQLRRDTTPEVYARLQATLPVGPRSTGPRPDHRSVRSVHVQERPGVAEVCATVHRGERAGALAFRLEGREGRWLCTELVGV